MELITKFDVSEPNYKGYMMINSSDEFRDEYNFFKIFEITTKAFNVEPLKYFALF